MLDGRNVSAGHASAFPEHTSATSQGPADARHTVVDVKYVLTQVPDWHVPLEQAFVG